MEKINGKLVLFNVGRVLVNLCFFTPFIVLFAINVGLTFADIMIIEAFFSILIVIFDVPCGHISDKFGISLSLFIGVLVQAISALLLFIFHSKIVFLLSQIGFAFGLSLFRGTDAAINHHLLEKMGIANKFETSESHFVSVLLFAESLAFILAGYVSKNGYELTFLLTFVSQVIGVLIILFFVRAPIHSIKNVMVFTERMQQICKVFHSTTSHKMKLVALLFIGTAFSTILYLAPAIAKSNGIDTYKLGIFYAIANMLAFGLSFYINRKNYKRILMPILAAVGFALVLKGCYLALLVGVGLVNAGRAYFLPYFRQEVISVIGAMGKATAMSVVSTIFSFGFAILAPIYGYITDSYGMKWLVIVSILSYLISLVILASSNAKLAIKVENNL